MGGHAGLGDAVHLLGADLQLDRRAERPDQRRVQRLVAVGLGDRDVVLEFARHRLVQAVQRAEREVAGRHAVLHDHPEAVDVVHLGKRKVLFEHLLVGAVDVLFAPVDHRLDGGVRQAGLDRLLGLADHLAPVAARRARRLCQHAMAQGIQVRERQFLEFLVQVVQAQAVGDRRVDLHGLARDAAALGRRDRAQRAHVVQPVRELDEDDAHVARHREQHLAEILGLRVLGRLELDLVELGQAVDQVRDRFAEGVGDLVLGDGGVLHHVVQQRGHQRLAVHVPAGEDFGDCERVRDVGLARLAGLPRVRGFAEPVGFAKLGDVHRLQVREQGLVQRGGDGSHGGRLEMGPAGRLAIDARSGGPLCVLTAPRTPVRSGCRDRHRRGRIFFQDFEADLAAGDFAQRDHGGLVLVRLDERGGARCSPGARDRWRRA